MNLDLSSVFVSSVIMYNTLVGVDVTHKLHWTPGERVGVFAPSRAPVWGGAEPHTCLPRAFFRATQLTSSARCPSGRWPSPSSASSSPTSGISRYSVSTDTFHAVACTNKINCVFFFTSLFDFLKKIKLRAEADLQSRHLYDGPHFHNPEPSESSPLLVGGR